MDKPLSVKEAAAYAHVCESVLRGWLRAGLAFYRLGLGRGKILIQQADLDAWIEACKVVANPAPVPVKSAHQLKHIRVR